MKKLTSILSLFLIIALTTNTVAQDVQKSKFWENVQFGGGINLGFGNSITNVGASPTAIYNFSDKFSAGIGVSYLYSKNRNFDVSANTFGGSVLTLFNPFQGGQLSAEFEQLQINYSGNTTVSNRSVPALYLGAAYTVGRNVAFGIRYDALYDENKSIYSSAWTPIVRVFF